MMKGYCDDNERGANTGSRHQSTMVDHSIIDKEGKKQQEHDQVQPTTSKKETDESQESSTRWYDDTYAN